MGRIAALERWNYLGRYRVELGAEFFDERARQLLAERAGALAFEAAIGGLGFQSRQALLRIPVVGAPRFQRALRRVAIRADARELRFERGLAGPRRQVLRRQGFEFALELGAFGVRAFQV